MDLGELMDRSRQEVSKRVDTVLSRLGYDFARVSGDSEPQLPRKFFFAADSASLLVSTLRRRFKPQVDLIISTADKILAHRFDLLGYEDLNYGDIIDWHLDLVHGKRSPRTAFYKIRYLSFEECGDSKITWELNRHQYLVTLAKAYRLTGDRRYADEALSQWKHWHLENPYPLGINWASSLEVAFRSLAWLWMYHFLEGTPVLPSGFREQWLRSQALNGRHIERYLSTHFSANTHLLGEGVALFFLGVLCPELPRASAWKARGWRIVLEESRRQVQSDGFHFEQSVYYHVYALDFFLHAFVLARLNGVGIPHEFENAIERMLQSLFLLGGSGAVPRLGDDDGGRLFDPRRNRTDHLLDPLATGAVLFNRPDFRALAGDLREETLWLLGERGIAEWDTMEPQRPGIASAALVSAGLYMLTTTNPPSELLVDAGHQGAQSGGHGHADALSMCLQSNGCPLLIDPGTFEYVGDGQERDKFRGTAMHNTLRVDGADQTEPSGPFAWKQLVHPKTERWIQGESFDLFIGSHDGYARLDPSIVHRRWVVALKSGLFLVRDLVHGKGRHRLDISWHMGPDVQLYGDGLFRAKGRAEGFALLTVQGSKWSAETVSDVWSPVYGQKRSATVVIFGITADLPAEFVTLIWLLPQSVDLPPTLSQIVAEGSAPPVQGYSLVSEDGMWQFFFGEGEPWLQGAIASDARFVCWHSRTGDVEGMTLILCDGTYVEIEGERILACKHAVSRCEWLVRGGTATVFCSDPAAIEESREGVPVPESLLRSTLRVSTEGSPKKNGI
jgi:hypothetical protein